MNAPDYWTDDELTARDIQTEEFLATATGKISTNFTELSQEVSSVFKTLRITELKILTTNLTAFYAYLFKKDA